MSATVTRLFARSAAPRTLAAIVILAMTLSFEAVAAKNKAPIVSITAPIGGTTFSTPATIAISATATDSDGTITGVEFYRGSTLLGSRTTPPYELAWSGVAVGSYS
ncbi:MAG: Ig-like domain-containing protein, partial [Burkholderiales bacterium]